MPSQTHSAVAAIANNRLERAIYRHVLSISLIDESQRRQPTNGPCALASPAYTAHASSALIDSARKHSPCPLITTAETQWSPGAQVRHAAESPMDPKRFHLNPRFKVVSRASSWWRMHFEFCVARTMRDAPKPAHNARVFYCMARAQCVILLLNDPRLVRGSFLMCFVHTARVAYCITRSSCADFSCAPRKRVMHIFCKRSISCGLSLPARIVTMTAPASCHPANAP